MPSLAIVVVLALATFRLARLIAADTITAPLRDRLTRWAWTIETDDETGLAIDAKPRAPWRTWVYELLTCQQCLGVWVGVAVYCAWRWGGDVALAILTVAALVGLQAFLAWVTEALSTEVEQNDDEDD